MPDPEAPAAPVPGVPLTADERVYLYRLVRAQHAIAQSNAGDPDPLFPPAIKRAWAREAARLESLLATLKLGGALPAQAPPGPSTEPDAAPAALD